MILSIKKYIYETPTDKYKLFNILYHWPNTNQNGYNTQKKIQSPSEILLYLLIKDRERNEKQIIQKKKKTAQRNSKYQDKFDHGFKKLVNIMPAWGEYFTCLLMWPSNPVSFLFFRKEKLFPLSSFLVRKIGFYTTFYDILTLAT